jgi:hypothetical protein
LCCFRAIEQVESVYQFILTHPKITDCTNVLLGVCDKLYSTIHAVASASLANGIIQQQHKYSNESAAGAFDRRDEHLKGALKENILLPFDRFAKPSRNMRRFLKVLCANASAMNVSVLEALWREVIVELVLEKCSKHTEHSTYSGHGTTPATSASASANKRLDFAGSHSPSHVLSPDSHARKRLQQQSQQSQSQGRGAGAGYGNGASTATASASTSASTVSTAVRSASARMDALLDDLMATLGEVRRISRTDMAMATPAAASSAASSSSSSSVAGAQHQNQHQNICTMSTELAYAAAMRRLPKETALEITKALVVRISSLVDAFKTRTMSREWALAVDTVTDFIQVKSFLICSLLVQ